MKCVSARIWRAALVASVALLTVSPPSLRPSKAVELSQTVGWWIAIDDALPKLWKLGAIAPMEEVLQIDAAGNVSDRIMNLQPATPKNCSGGRVCSEFPPIASARLQLSASNLVFTDVTDSNAQLDSVAGTLLIRQQAATTTREWVVSVAGNRMTLQAAATGRFRYFARIDPAQLRAIYAGLLASNWPAQESWRCFLGNAMSDDPAFAPLHADRSYRRPAFLDRYLKLASHIVAIRAALAFDGTGTQQRQPADSPEQSLIDPLDKIARPLSAEDRKRLSAVLSYIDQHRRALVAFDEASAKAAATRAAVSSTSWEAANRETTARSATDIANAAETKVKTATADYERIQASSAFQTKSAREAYVAAKQAMATVALKENASTVAAAVSDAARRLAQAQQKKEAAARSFAAGLRQYHEAAVRTATEQMQAVEQAKIKAKQQQQKAAAAATAASDLQTKVDIAKAAADDVRRKYEAAKIATDNQQRKTGLLAAAVESFDAAVVAAQKAVEHAEALSAQNKDQPTTDASAKGTDSSIETPVQAVTEAARELAGTAKRLREILATTVAARDKAKSEAQAAATMTGELTSKAKDIEAQLSQALGAEKAAQSVADKAKLDAAAATAEAVRLVAAIRTAELRATAASEATKAAAAARDASQADLASQEARTAELNKAAEHAAAQAKEMLGATQTAADARNRAVGVANEAVAEATRLIEVARNAEKALNTLRESAKAASATAQEADSRYQAAAQAAAKAASDSQAATGAMAAAREALKVAVANQPTGDGLISIGTAEIAALARVFDEAGDGKKLFCLGQPVANLAATPADLVSPAISAHATTTAHPPHAGVQQRSNATAKSEAKKPSHKRAASRNSENQKTKSQKTKTHKVENRKSSTKKVEARKRPTVEEAKPPANEPQSTGFGIYDRHR
jgi:hypothetical protein